MRKKTLKKSVLELAGTLSLFAVLLAALPAQALTISPLPRIDMVDGVGTVRAGDDGNYWRAEVYEVDQSGGEDILVPARDVVVSPRMFKAPKSVRIATKIPPDGKRELFYRLILTQQVQRENGLKSQLSISIPVVQPPSDPVAQHTCFAGKVTNTGNVHIRATTEDRRVIYILPGAVREVPLGAKNTETGETLCIK